jgi:hypothetical protein
MARRTSPVDLLEDARIWGELIALGSLKSEAAVSLQERAEVAFQRLPADLPPERLGQILDLYLRDARHVLWRSMEKLSPGHMEVLLAKLAQLGPPYRHTPQRELQHRMLLLAGARGIPTCQSVGELLRRQSKFRHVPEAVSKLRLWKDVPADLVEVLDTAIEEQQLPPSLTEQLVFWCAVYLVARRSSQSPGLLAVRSRLPAWKTERMGELVESTFDTVVAAAG